METRSSENRRKFFLIMKGIGILAVPFALYFIPFSWFEGEGTLCIYKNITGHDCYGCGITRAVVSAARMNFDAAWEYNKMVAVVAPLLAFLWSREFVKLWREVKQIILI